MDTIQDDQRIQINDVPEADCDMYYRFLDVKTIEYFCNLVRSSYEYKTIVAYMKSFMDFESCVYYEGYSMKNGFRVELHHTPFTLFDITEAVANKHMQAREKVRAMDVAEEVAQLHFKFQVGFVPLNPTAHDLFHNGHLEIHPDLIRGYWEEFYDIYKSYLSPEAHAKYKRALEMRTDRNPKVPKILQRAPVLLEVKEFLSLTKADLNHIAIESPLKRLEALNKPKGE